jgi:hypothetical protein
MNEEEQIPSSLNFNEQRLKTCLGTIRESAKLVWTRLILGHYTNHGIDHSERIIEKIGKLLEDRRGFRISFDLQSLKGTSLTFSI